MKGTEEETRLQRNAYRRKQYAELPPEKKNILLRKKRENYVKKKLKSQEEADLLRKRREDDAIKTILIGNEGQTAEVSEHDVQSHQIQCTSEEKNMANTREKRLQTNKNQRKRYVELSEEKKNILLGKQRKSYAKKRKLTSEEQKNASLRKRRENYARKKILIGNQKGTANVSEHEVRPGNTNQTITSSIRHGYLTGHEVQEIPSNTTPNKDFPIAGRRQIRHVTTITSAQVDNMETEIQVIDAHEYVHRNLPSRTREKMKLNKGVDRSIDDILENIVDEPLTLPLVRPCKYCSAKRFHREPNGFCCSNGEVALISNVVPDDLYDLYTSKSEHASEFRTYIRTYNNTFAFTSFGVTYDRNLSKRNKGIYTFRIQGQVYHYINEIMPTNNDPSYLQLYFYDTDHEIQNRLNHSNRLNSSIVEKLINILKVNPYAIFFRSLASIHDWTNQQIIIKSDASLDQRVFNTPSSSQVAAIWFENMESIDRKGRDIIVYNHSGYKHRVEYYYGCYDPLQYPLLFSFGETGWHQGIGRVKAQDRHLCEGQFSLYPHGMQSSFEIINKEKKVLEAAKKKRGVVSCREYYCYKLQIRPGEKSILLRAGRLLQQYAVDMYVKLETSRLDYFRQNQDDIRAEIYQGIKDSISTGETRASKVGKRIVLPSSFTGGPRDMRKRYVDAMTLVQNYGKPDILLTMTCNPNWSEIKSELSPLEEPQNRPDLLARIFRAKLELLKDELIKKEIFGPIVAYTYVIEYQKRGLPHAHFLLILEKAAKLLSPDSYDKIVSAELPDEEKYPHLYKMVVKHMMHGPCGNLNPQNICMQRDGKCKNHYPKNFCSVTTQGNDSYPIYRRRDDGKKVKVRKHILNNQWVVPYNAYLLAKFDCHINVEICSSIKVVKYLYKYIYKGRDQVAFNVVADEDSNNIDEIQRFQSGRWISHVEAMWRIYRFTLNEMRPAVQSLHLHLEGKQLVTFRKYDRLENVIKSNNSTATMLTEFFHYNKTHQTEEKYLYKDFPQHFVWNQQDKIWTKRRQKNVIGRIVIANPAECERYYLRLLLNHIKGPTSYEDLRTVNNCLVSTFREAALLHGLLESDNSLELCLEEATSYQMPETLRRLFATILVYCSPNNPKKLWESYEHAMSEDYKRTYCNDSNNRARIQALRNINSKLHVMGRTLRDYALSTDEKIYDEQNDSSNEIENELNLVVTEKDINAANTLNSEQRYAYDVITNRIFSNKNGVFFIDGPGGTGKTYLYCALLATVRSKGLIALATATSGVAASILPGGRTAHSRFKIPIDVDDKTTCNVSKQSALAKLLRAAKLIIWDEASMAKRQVIETFNSMLQDVNDCELPFGGKVVIFGGDFRQILPVMPKATREESIDASLLRSPLWPTFEKIRLTQNMRAKFDPSFTDFLLRIGNGIEQPIYDCQIKIPTYMLIPYSDNIESIKLLAKHVFPNLEQYAAAPELMTYRAILTPTNDYVDDINNLLIDAFPGNITKYISFDKTIDESQQSQHEDFLNTLTPKGLPPHILQLKPNCPVILLRNIDPPEGLSNGTRLICRSLTPNLIYAEIAVGSHQGKKVFIPRIPLRSSDNDKYPVPFERKQFPVRLCYAMTINKAQGQTLENVGLYLPQPVFSHGQLYVALSRAKTSSAVKVMIKPICNDKSDYNYTKNVVFEEILALAKT